MPQVTRTIAIPAAGGTPVIVRCTRVCVRMQVTEDGSANSGFQQGLIYQQLTPQGFGVNTVGPTVTVAPNLSLEPIIFESRPNDHSPYREAIGNGGSGGQPVGPGGPATIGTVVAQFTSASALATTIDVVEWDG